MQYLLEARNINFRGMIDYPPIGIEAGKTTFIRGSSGCGKSTLLKMFNGTVNPDRGQILYKGEAIAGKEKTALRKKVLLVAQNPYLFSGTIAENFKEYYGYREQEPPSKETMERMLELCSITFPLDADCSALSGGERQRVFLAIFLSFLPEVLMLDEPTAALDTQTGRQVIEQIRQYCREHGITLVIVSHDRDLTEQFGEKVITLKRGAEAGGARSGETRANVSEHRVQQDADADGKETAE